MVLLRPRGAGGVASVVDRLAEAGHDGTRVLPIGRRHGEHLGIRAGCRDAVALRWVLRQGTDIVHLHPSLRWRSLVRDAGLHAVARRGGCATVVQFHGWNHDLAQMLDADRSGTAMLVRTLGSADAILVLAAAFAERLVDWGIDRNRVEVVSNPYDPSVIPVRRRLGPPMILFLGRLVAAKGVDRLIRALGVLDRPEVELVVAGSGPEIGRLSELAHALGLRGRVRFPGWVTGATKRDLLGRTSVLALPSRDEALPVAVIEALASRVPVVAAATGALPERIGPAGWLVDRPDPRSLARALARALDDPDRGHRGPDQVVDCTPAAVRARMVDIYDRVLGGR